MENLFASLDSRKIAEFIRTAKQFVSYAGPGLQNEPAAALVEVAERLGTTAVDLCIDLDERVVRMGYGTIEAITKVRDVGVHVRSSSGLRTGLIIVDDAGYYFTPIALYLEAEPQSAHSLNAMALSREAVAEALVRLSPATKERAVSNAAGSSQRERILETIVEVNSTEVDANHLTHVADRLAEAPPVKFDVARQVRVFEPFLQYVELKLTGAALQRHRIAMPPEIMKMGGGKEMEGRLKTTFDLIEKGGALSSKDLESELNEMRKDLSPSLGKTHGRLILKAKKPLLNKRIEDLRGRLEAHQEKVKGELDKLIDESRKQIIYYYAPRVVADPPDSLLGQVLTIAPTEKDARAWLHKQLDKVLPNADSLISKMELEVQYKDVTFETLNKPDFLEALKEAFDQIDWDKAYAEFKAAGETRN